MRLLIIGASGSIGTHVRGRALAAGMEVVTAGRTASLDALPHYHADLAEDPADKVAALVDEVAPDVVVNCVGATTGELDAMVAVNVTGVYTLTKAMLMARAAPRLVHLGSAAEYGRAEPGVPVSEQAVPRPAGVYGVTKLAGTRLVELATAAGLDGVVLRVFNPVGPGTPSSNLPGKVAAELHRALAHGTAIKLGSLDTVRDFVDVRDVADAVIAAVTAPTLAHGVLNIGSGRGVPVRAMVQQLLSIAGYAGEIHEDSAGPARAADIPWQEASITCTIEDLGWKPCRDLTTSLTDLWKASH
jgi:nucleoside-diphosphate-sugar epimerase